MWKILTIAILIGVSGCAPKSWNCDDPQVLAAVREIVSEKVPDSTKLMASLASINSSEVDTAALTRALADGLKDLSRTVIVDSIDKSFDKSIGKRACSATIKYKLTDAAIPSASLFERNASTDAITGSFEHDKKSGILSSTLLYSSQPTSDGKKMLTTVESAGGLIAGAYMLESMWAVAQAQLAKEAEESKKMKAIEGIVASFNIDCLAASKTNAIGLGGMSESEALDHANKACTKVTQAFSACALKGGKPESCSKLVYTSNE